MDKDDWFGRSLGCLGDLDGDGVPDLIVGAPGDDGGGPDRGALYVLFMQSTGRIKKQQKISSLQGGLLGQLTENQANFGWAISVGHRRLNLLGWDGEECQIAATVSSGVVWTECGGCGGCGR